MTSPEDDVDQLTLQFRSMESQIRVFKKDLKKVTFADLQEVGTDVPRAATSLDESDDMSSVSVSGGNGAPKTVNICEFGKIELGAVSKEDPLNGNKTVKTSATSINNGSVTKGYRANSCKDYPPGGGNSAKPDGSPNRTWDSDIEMNFSGQVADEDIIDPMPFAVIRNMILDIATLPVEERQEVNRLVELYEPPNVTSISSQNEIRFWYLSNSTLRAIKKYVSSKLLKSQMS